MKVNKEGRKGNEGEGGVKRRRIKKSEEEKEVKKEVAKGRKSRLAKKERTVKG